MSNTYLKLTGKYLETSEEKIIRGPNVSVLTPGRYVVEINGKPVEKLDTGKPLTVQVPIS